METHGFFVYLVRDHASPSKTQFQKLIFFRQNDAEIDKENLKDLVSKWNESPNNRYAFDQASESVISPSGDLIPAGALLMRRTSGDASGGRRGSLARGKLVGAATQPRVVQTDDNLIGQSLVVVGMPARAFAVCFFFFFASNLIPLRFGRIGRRRR